MSPFCDLDTGTMCSSHALCIKTLKCLFKSLTLQMSLSELSSFSTWEMWMLHQLPSFIFKTGKFGVLQVYFQEFATDSCKTLLNSTWQIVKRDKFFCLDEIIGKATHRQKGPFQMQLLVCLHPFLLHHKLLTKLPKILGPAGWWYNVWAWATVHVLTYDARWVWLPPERLWANSMTRGEQVKRW